MVLSSGETEPSVDNRIDVNETDDKDNKSVEVLRPISDDVRGRHDDERSIQLKGWWVSNVLFLIKSSE